MERRWWAFTEIDFPNKKLLNYNKVFTETDKSTKSDLPPREGFLDCKNILNFQGVISATTAALTPQDNECIHAWP